MPVKFLCCAGMSRARRRRLQQNSPYARKQKWRKIVLWSCASLFAVVVLGSLAAYVYVRSFLSGDKLRSIIVQNIDSKLKVKSELTPLRWESSNVNCSSLQLGGGQLLQSASIKDMDLSFDFSQLWWQSVSVDPMHIGALSITLDLQQKSLEQPPAAATGKPAGSSRASGESYWQRNWMPKKFDLDNASIDDIDISLHSKQGVFKLQDLRANLNGDSQGLWRLAARDGKLTTPWPIIEKLSIDELSASYQNNRLAINQLDGKIGKTGVFNTNYGDWDRESGNISLSGGVKNLLLEDLIGSDWQKHVSGVMNASYNVEAKDGQPLQVHGKMKIERGVVTALPVLDTIAAFAATVRFRTLQLNSCEANYSWSKEQWRASDIVMSSDGLLRVEGFINCKQDNLQGRLWVGIPSGLLAHIPGAETKVFLAQNNGGKYGLNWAEMNISGSLGDIKEDLSARLINAAGERLFEIIPGTGRKVLLFSENIVDKLQQNLPQDVLQKGVEEAGKGLNKVLDILN